MFDIRDEVFTIDKLINATPLRTQCTNVMEIMWKWSPNAWPSIGKGSLHA